MSANRWTSALLAGALFGLFGCGGDEEEAPAAPEPEVAEVPEVIEEEIVEEAPPVVTPTSHDVLFLVIHDEPLLPSEERQLGVLVERLERRRRFDVEQRDATDEERALAEVFLNPDASDADRAGLTFPATFGSASRVLVMQLMPPRTVGSGDRVTEGYGGILLLDTAASLPAAQSATFVGLLDEDSYWHLTDDRWALWLGGLLRHSEGG
jgi:hypothetical protein